MPLTYTNIQHNFRRFHGLSNTEYVFLDMINVLSHADNKKGGWCYQSKETMCSEMELSKPAILKMIEKMIVNGFLIKHPQTKYLRTTDKWKDVYFAENEKQKQWTESRNELLVIPSGKESLPRKAVKNIGKQSLPSDGKQSLPREDFSGKESLPNNNTCFYNNSKYNNKAENLQFSPPLSQTSLSEIPTGSENETSTLKEKSIKEKPNSGGGAAQNVGNSVSEALKPKKTAVAWFKLNTLTDTQKYELNALAGDFDNPMAFIESLDKWLVYKESGQVNFTLKKIPPYKDFDTMLSTMTTEAKKCQYESEAFAASVKDSIDKLYFGLFSDKFISKANVKNGNYNNKQTATDRNNEFMRNIYDHLPNQ